MKLKNIFNRKSRLNRKYNTKRHMHKEQILKHYIPLKESPTVQFPPKLNNGTILPPCQDQGQYGTCYAHAAAGAVNYNELKYFKAPSVVHSPSRLGIAWNACIQEKEVNVTEEDGIASLYNTLIPITTLGFFPEEMFPYVPSNINVQPSPACFIEGKKHLGLSVTAVAQDLNSLKSAIVEGQVIVFGMLIYPQYESNQCLKDGKVETPGWFSKHFSSSLGGHAQLIVGYDDDIKCFIVRGSWGPSVADHGYFYIPYDYITDSILAFDFQIL